MPAEPMKAAPRFAKPPFSAFHWEIEIWRTNTSQSGTEATPLPRGVPGTFYFPAGFECWKPHLPPAPQAPLQGPLQPRRSAAKRLSLRKARSGFSSAPFPVQQAGSWTGAALPDPFLLHYSPGTRSAFGLGRAAARQGTHRAVTVPAASGRGQSGRARVRRANRAAAVKHC